MAITSGVRAVTGYVTVGGQPFGFETASIEQAAERQSSTFSANVPLNSFPGGGQFFSQLAGNSASLIVMGNTLIVGEIDSAEIDYVNTRVQLNGRDASASLHDTQSNEAFQNQTRSEIVQTIAQKVGLTAQISGGALLAGKELLTDYVKLTDGISYAAILHKLAELENTSWFVSGSTLNFGQSAGGSYPIIYNPGQPARGNFIHLTVGLNCQAAKSLNVNVKGWNSNAKKVVSSTKKMPSANQGGGSLNYNLRAEQTQQDHADDLAMNKLGELASHELTLRATMVGDPTISPAMQIQLSGTDFDQSFDIQHIHHSIGFKAGWVMEIQAKSARQGRTAQ